MTVVGRPMPKPAVRSRDACLLPEVKKGASGGRSPRLVAATLRTMSLGCAPRGLVASARRHADRQHRRTTDCSIESSGSMTGVTPRNSCAHGGSMMSEPTTRSGRRQALFEKARSAQYRFPEAVAFLFSVVLEPRDDGRCYSAAFNEALSRVQGELWARLSELADTVDSLTNATGKVEQACLTATEELLGIARTHELQGVANRLSHAQAVSTGDRSLDANGQRITTPQFPSVPTARMVRPDRPPVGRWR